MVVRDSDILLALVLTHGIPVARAWTACDAEGNHTVNVEFHEMGDGVVLEHSLPMRGPDPGAHFFLGAAEKFAHWFRYQTTPAPDKQPAEWDIPF